MDDLNVNPAARPEPVVAKPGFAEEEIDLMEYLGVLLAYKWLIAAIALVGVFLGGSYAILATPVYQANALIQVEDQSSSGLSALGDVADLLEGDAAIEAEMQLIRSRMVIQEAVKQLGLNVVAEPLYFPVIGKAVSRYFKPEQPGVAKPWFDLPQYAWGGEKITVDYLELPDALLGETLQLVAGQSGEYQLLGPDDAVLLKGQVGKLAEVSLGAGRSIRLFVSSLTARTDTHFNLVRYSPATAIELLLENLSVNEKGKKSGMLEVTFSGPNQTLITDVLNKIADIYVAQNISRSSAEAELSLGFLEKQLPPLKERVDAAENAYNQYRTQHSSVDLEVETRSVLEGLVQMEKSILDLQQERDELRKRFKPSHPVIKALDGKLTLLTARTQKLEKEADQLPETQRDILRLARDVEVNTGLYTKLLNIAQELRVVKAGTVGNVRIIDYAMHPEEAVKPKKKLIVAIALVASLFFGVILAFFLKAVRGGVSDPDDIERHLGLPVYASILHSKLQEKMMKKARKSGLPIGVLAAEQPDDPAIESFRSLRTTLHFSLKNAANNIIMVAGASPKVGKSFTAINMATVLASNGKNVLLIDGDLRRGYLHRYFGYPRGVGLAELITDSEESVTENILRTNIPGLFVLTTGQLPPNPAELLLHESFQKKLGILSRMADYIIIDGPPILAVTDAAIIGRYAATTLLVVKSNFHPMRELEQATRQLQQAGVSVKGALFNDVELNAGRYGYGKYVYQYDYKTT